MTSLNNFITAIKTGGLAKPSKYEVVIGKPAVVESLKYKEDNNWRKMLLFCEQATLPGVNYTTTQSRTFGEFREMPYERIFDPLQLSFYCDSDMWIKGFFDEWMANIQNSKTREFSYYDKYTVPITITTVNNEGRNTYGIKLFECYPKTITAVQLDYGAKDVMKLSVSMQYRYYTKVEYATIPNTATNAQNLRLPTNTPFAQVVIPQENRLGV
jgi:hypothetical protein